MAHAENSLTINRPSKVVYDFLADGLNNPKWRPAVVEITLKSGKAGTVGAEYAQLLKGPGGRTVQGDYRLTEATPASKLAFTVTAGPARPQGRFVLEAAGTGTRVTFILDLTTRGFMKLMEPMVAKTMKGEVARLQQLKAVLEG
jgi:hypothetical protein